MKYVVAIIMGLIGAALGSMFFPGVGSLLGAIFGWQMGVLMSGVNKKK